MPLYRRLPKRGFNAIIKKHSYDQMIINLNDIQHLIEKKKLDTASKVTLDSLRKVKNIKNNFKRLKILGNGEIKSKIQIEAHQISASAKTKIEKAGGSVNLLKQAEAK
jgi:large subunit ribosomal protein L15